MFVPANMRPATSLRLLCEVAQEYGLNPDVCLDHTGIAFKDLNTATAQCSRDQEIQAIANLAQLVPNTVGLGAAVGTRMHVHAFGIWGFAILTSPTLRSAIQTCLEYVKLSFVIADMELDVAEDKARIEFDMKGLPPTTHRYVVEKHAVVAMTFCKDLIQDPDFQDFEIETSDDDPAYARELSWLIGIPVTGATTGHALTFPAAILDSPLPKSDPVTHQYCIDQCKDLLDRIDGALPEWSQKVRDAIVELIGSEQKIEEIADKLSVTERTLRRRLTEEGTSFRDLCADVRMRFAHELLRTSGLNVETVAWRVGYSEPASFVRAFSKKFSKTPGEIRKEKTLGRTP